MAEQRNQVTIPAALVPKIWTKKVWHEGLKESFFDKFTAMDGSNVVHKNKDLEGVKGDAVTFGLMMNLSGAGVEGNRATLTGNEETLNIYDFTVQTQLVRNAVSRFEADDQKTQSSITANDKLTTTLISRAKRKAKMHGPKVAPIKVDGMDKYIMLVSTWAARDLKDDAKWLAAQQNANIRGSKNPIFTGALGEYDGVILYEYERVLNDKTGASGETHQTSGGLRQRRR